MNSIEKAVDRIAEKLAQITTRLVGEQRAHELVHTSNGTKEKAPKEVWAFADEEDADRWVGGYPSRDEAIEEAEYSFDDDSEIWVQRGELVPTSKLLPDVDDILERIKENAYECTGEDDLISVSPAGAKELQDMLIAWADHHIGDTGAWRGVGKPELIRGVGCIDGEDGSSYAPNGGDSQ